MTDTILITGGSDGIGFGLARRFVAAGATVLITGRSPDKLRNAQAVESRLHTFVSDAGLAQQREELATHVRREFSGLTWLINNAGIQRRIALAEDTAPWNERQEEIDLLFSAPVHLNHLLAPLLVSQNRPTTIVNVTSGGAYVPQVFAPVYSASKAALHSYTTTLRHALARTQCRVVELIPPAVQTRLAAPPHGAPLDAFCDSVFEDLQRREALHVGFGATAGIENRSAEELDRLFEQSARRAAVRQYPGM